MNRDERTEYIYVLLDGNDHIFYCGRSANIEKRLREHVEESVAGGTSRKCRHIRELLARGDQIKVKQVDEAPASEIAQREAWWIEKLDFNVEDLGYTVVLFNGNAGSQGCRVNEQQLREQISDFKAEQKKRKRAAPSRPLTPPTADQIKEALHLYETDPARFKLILEARRELRKIEVPSIS